MLNLDKNVLIISKISLALAILIFCFHILFPQYANAAEISDDEVRLQLSILQMANQKELMLYNPDDNDPDNLATVPFASPDADIKANIRQYKKQNLKSLSVSFNLDEVQAYVASRASQLGLNVSQADRIVTCESRWNPGAANFHNRNGSYDLGLWQINSIHKDLTDSEKLDYKKATDWALNKRVADGNWSAWYCARKLGIS